MEMLFSCPCCTWRPFGIPKSEFGSLAENGRFLNKPLIWKCYFPVPAALVGGAHLASQNQLFGSLAENGRFLNKPLIWKCYFPVPAALAPIWRPKINYLGALPKMVDFLISR